MQPWLSNAVLPKSFQGPTWSNYFHENTKNDLLNFSPFLKFMKTPGIKTALDLRIQINLVDISLAPSCLCHYRWHLGQTVRK